MGDPLPRMETGGPAAGASTPLADAASRLDRALDMLEASFRQPLRDGGPPAEDLAPTDAARVRELEAAAHTASLALGHAIAEVRRLLHDDPAGPDEEPDPAGLDLALESAPRLLDDSDDAPDPRLRQEPDEDPDA